MPDKIVIPIDIPDNTESLHNLGEWIMSYQPRQNAFLNALVNRIGRVIITSRLWTNPWSVFKKGYLEFGETVEEIFVNIAKPHSFDPAVAEKEIYKREFPDVRAAFHSMNFQKFYKVTISNDQLRQAFLSWDGITDLIARIVDSLYTGMEYDEFVTMKYMVARAMVNGQIKSMTTPVIRGEGGDPEAAVIAYRETGGLLNFLSPNYNMAGVMNATPTSEQIIIVPAWAEALIGVKVLAAAFNFNEVDYLGTRVLVDSFEEHDFVRLGELFGDDPNYTPFTAEELAVLGSVSALVTDRDFWMVFDNFMQFTQNYNGEGLYWQYWYHAWKTFSISPFANAVAFSSTESAVTSVTVSPAAANVAQGSDLVLTATVEGTGMYDKVVTWAIEGNVSGGTTINPNTGRLHIAADEPAEVEGAAHTITITATGGDGKAGTSTVTVVAQA